MLLDGFGPGAGGWISNDLYPREAADIYGDGKADVVAFGYSAVYVAIAAEHGLL
jgi:hypothetical protein